MACGHMDMRQGFLISNIAKRYFMCKAHFIC